MKLQAQTFSVHTSRPNEVIEAFRRWASKGPSGVVFLSGHLPGFVREIARAAALLTRGKWLFASGAGVLTEEGEFEGESLAGAMVFQEEVAHLVRPRADLSFGDALYDHQRKQPGTTALVLLRSDCEDEGWLAQVNQPPLGAAVFGGGTLPGIDHCGIDDGIVTEGAAAALLLPPTTMSRIRSSAACRLLTPLRPVTRARGPMLHEIEGAPALDRLNDATSALQEQTLVLLAIAAEAAALSPEGRNIALRAIQGVDPGRGSLMLGEELTAGTRVAFAIRDPHGARTDLEAQLRNLRKSCAGTAPEFGLYLCCAGRGSGLYGTPDVDVRLIRRFFPRLQLLGLSSTFEVAPLDDHVVPQIYAGVLGIFCRPS